MNCEEFELRGLDLDRHDANPIETRAAVEHASNCPRCRGLLESWREVKRDLRLLGRETFVNTAPARVEMRLRQELQTRRESRVPRRSLAVAGWALAAAAVLVASIGWVRNQGKNTATDSGQPPLSGTQISQPVTTEEPYAVLVADNDGGEFTQLPGSLAGGAEDAAILQVRMQRGALVRFGLPVAQEAASDWVDVDFLVGEDGLPQAVRLHQDNDAATASE